MSASDTLKTPAADMTIQQHAAINLMIPVSGCVDLDRMIWEAKRDHIAAQIIAARVSRGEVDIEEDALGAYRLADEMLAASGWEQP